jgi:hypothetical protein
MLIDIHTKNRNFGGFRFLKSIMSPYSVSNKPHMNLICIKDGRACSTNGSRIAVFDCGYDYYNGLYAITVCRTNIVQIAKSNFGTDRFPNYESIIDMDGYVLISDNEYHVDDSLSGYLIFDLAKNDIIVNPKLFEKLTGYWKVFIKKDAKKRRSNPIIFKTTMGEKIFAMMPLRSK